jgi:hypothetical protein
MLTTSIFQCWQQLYATLESASFGVHPANPGPFVLHFGFPDDKVELGQENVTVLGVIEQESQRQATFGPGRREEEFGLLLFVTVAVPGIEHGDVIDRLEFVTAAIETAVRTSSAPPSRAPRPDVQGVDWWGVTSIRPQVYGTANGHVGVCELTVSVRAHI